MTNRPPLVLDLALAPLASLYASVMKARNLSYDRNWLAAYDVAAPVLSIGNLTAGGTGKTPITAMIVGELLRRGVALGIISRGYGGQIKDCARVPASAAEAKIYGDEPTWFAQSFPTVPVYVGPDKVSVARELRAKENVKLILADDAFQHRRLRRQMDLVVVDATEPQWHYRSLPQGRMRESFKSLRRAHGVFISKVNMASPEALSWVRAQIKEGLSGTSVPVYELESAITGFLSLTGARIESLQNKKLLLVSGIGRPHTFSQLVKESVNVEVVDHLVFPDHHAYTPEDLKKIEQRASELKVDAIVVTEKDAVKLADWKSQNLPCLVSRLQVRAKEDLGEFYEAIGRLVL